MPTEKNSFTERVKESPGVALLLTLGTIAGAAVSINAGLHASDAWIVTEEELAEHAMGIHAAGERLIQEVEIKSECRWLDDKIDLLDDKIYELKRDNANPDRVHDKEQDLRKYRDQYRDRGCGKVKY